jgi:NADH:ubiquinone oxidoreductase subunit E
MENIKGYLKLSGEGITEDKRFSLESAWCVGACGFAPVVEIDHDTHGGVNPDKVEELLKPYE